MITHAIDLDMYPSSVPVVVHVSQYDDDFSLVFTLFSSVGTFNIESGTTAAIRGSKTDGNGYSVAATIDITNKKVTVAGNQQMTACAGKNVFELTLTKNGKELNTANFILDVERAALDKDTLPSNSVIKELVNVIDRTDELIGAARQIRDDKLAVEQYKTAAQTAASNASTSATNAATSAAGAEQAKQTAISTVNGALDAINAAKQAAIDDLEDVEADAMDDINARAAQIVQITTNAEEIATQALNTALNTENHMSSLDSQMQALERAMQDVSIDPDDLGLEQDPDTYYVYPTYKGVRSENGIPLSAGGGGGGGGGDVVKAILNVENTSGWLSKTIPTGSPLSVSFSWSSVEDGMPTGDGAVRISVGEVVKSTYQVSQGNITVDLTPYIKAGPNKVKVRISDVYDQGKTTTFNITAIELSISSTFDASQIYSGAFSLPFTPVGAVEKTVYMEIDGTVKGTMVTSVTGRPLSFAVPAQSHGAHSIKLYFEATINGETVRSNELYFEFIYAEPLNNQVIIASSFNAASVMQYALVPIPYLVYNPTSLTSQVTISINGTVVTSQTVDRTEQSYAYRANAVGPLEIVIASGGITKTLNTTVEESDVDVEAETEGLSLYLTSQGRSNNEAHPDTWTYGEGASQIAATFSGFNWASDGWIPDAKGATALRVAGDARVSIPYQIFASDFRSTGKTIEIEFATHNVLDYDAVIMSCMSGGRGISITAQKALLKSEQSEISTQYKEDEHVRIAFVVQKRTENRLLFIYINGIASGVVQYATDDDFSQVNPVNILIGSNDCTIDVYNIRIYDAELSRFQILDNWIADTQDVTEMLDRYQRNNVFDQYEQIVIPNLPSYLPYMVITCEKLPASKGDKQTCSGSFVYPLFPSKSFTFENCQIDVQGTSSQYYPRKNYKMKFNGGFTMTSSGSTVAKYAMTPDSIPVKTFCMKADFASSEGANNVELARLYEKACPYKTPAQIADSKVRQGIDGFPMLIFWNDSITGDTTFLGKYNFNNDKSTEEVFGFVDPDESWETLHNAGADDPNARVLWKSADFSGTAWLSDFEARYPDTDPPYQDPSQLQAFAEWVVTTDTDAATGAPLPESVVYGDTTYTNDTAAYRLAKFKAEAGNYMEIDSALFYYLFTELFLMVDSRAKNAFPSFMGSEVIGS